MVMWSWVLTAVGVFGLFLAGRRVWWAWFVGLGAQSLWLIYAIVTDQWGFIVSAFAYGWVYAKNGIAWTRDRPRRDKSIEPLIGRAGVQVIQTTGIPEGYEPPSASLTPPKGSA